MKYRINKKLSVVEKPKLEDGASGWIVDMGGKDITIEIKSSLSDTEKALTIMHELVHYVQYRMDENNTQKAREKTAKEIEKFIVDICVKYPSFVKGLNDLIT